MNDNLIITIGRQFGSGGREIGKLLSEKLGIAYYDKELLNEASKESGLSPEYFERADEKAPNALRNVFSVNWIPGAGSFWSDGGLSNEYIFKFQSDVILRLADERPCVIVGRCADYILRNHPYCYNFFIHAPLEDRIRRIVRRAPHLSDREAKELSNKYNKSRAAYYNFYTDKGWGEAESYDLTIDSSILGCEATADFIIEFIRKRQEAIKAQCPEF